MLIIFNLIFFFFFLPKKFIDLKISIISIIKLAVNNDENCCESIWKSLVKVIDKFSL